MALQHILKNSAVSGKEPTASQLANGEIALNYHVDGPFLTCKDTSGAIRRITGVWINATSPSTPTPGEFWLDISVTPAQLKIYKDTTDTWIQTYTVAVASTAVSGIVELATDAETITGADALRAVTPASLQAKLSDSTGLANSARIASSAAVKSAYDLANAALPRTGGTITGAVQFALGAAATPSITFTGDTNTGLFSPSADQLSVTTGGIERLRIDAAGQIEAVSLGTAAAPTWSFVSDPNTGIYSPGADQLALSTGGTGRLFVDASGRVGIGVTPTTTLDVAGPIRSLNGTIDARLQAGYAGAVGIGAQSNDAVLFIQNATERMRIDSSGRVGIGTSIPGALLETSSAASGTVNGEVVLQRSRSNPTGNTVFLDIKSRRHTAGTSWEGVGLRLQHQVDATLMGFIEFNSLNGGQDIALGTAGTTRLLINSAGRVGIGTSSPGAALDVAGNIRLSAAAPNIEFNNGGGMVYGPASNTIAFATGGGPATPIERARIDANGRLLVGTSASTALLGYNSGAQFAAGTGTVSLIRNTADNGACEIVYAKSRGTSGAPAVVASGDGLSLERFAGYDGAAYIEAARITAAVDGTPGTNDMPGRLVFSTTADGASTPTERVRIDSSGMVGIGTSTPSSELDVNNGLITAGQSGAVLRGRFSSAFPSTGGGYFQLSTNNTDGFNGGLSISTLASSTLTERFRIDSSGNVGIGTSSPGSLLDVRFPTSPTTNNGNGFNTLRVWTSSALAADTGGAISLGGVNATGGTASSFGQIAGRKVNATSADYAGYLQFSVNNAGGTMFEAMRIDSSGRVGIGTSTPQNRLEVIGDGGRMVCRNATNSGIARIEAQVQDYTSGPSYIGTSIVQNGSTTAGTNAGLSNANLGILNFQNTSAGLVATNGAVPLVFATTSVERMRLTGNGILALGTSVAPIGTHEFCWQGSHRCAFRNVDSTASNCNGLLIAYDNAAPNGTANDFLLCTDNAATRAAIRSNGGIANFQANNVNLSDINLKKNILPANSTWEHLKQWEIVSYQYKDQSNESDLNFGVIAQQVAEISPEVITVFQKATQGQPDQLGVKEQQMYWMAIKALQEAVDRIETLEAKVAALEAA